MNDERKVQADAVHQLAARLANTGQVLSAWAAAIGTDDEIAMHRLLRAAHGLDQVVGILSVDDEEFVRLDEEATTCDVSFSGRSVGGDEGSATGQTGEQLGLRGRSDMISLVEYVAFLSSLQRDGVLKVQAGDGHYIVEFRYGCVVYVTVSPKDTGLHLGEVLIEDGAISRGALRFGSKNVRADEFLGEALIRQGLVSKEGLIAALTRQAMMTFCRMHRTGCGFNFQFEENARVVNDPDIRLGVAHLLLESARLFDEELRDHPSEVASQAESTPQSKPGEKLQPKPKQMPASVAKSTEALPDRPGSKTKRADAAPPTNGRFGGAALTLCSHAEALDRFRKELAKIIDRGEVELPVLPNATGQLLAMCWGDRFDPEELVTWVQRDQALCAHLLRVANSAAYAPASPIYSAHIAIARLGLDKLRQITLALTLKQKVFQIPGWENVIKSLWHDAAVTSGFGGAVGKSCGAGAVRGSMVGLLLDVGKPIILNALHDVQSTIGSELTAAIAQPLMDEFHGPIGELLAAEWNLPDWVIGGMRHHHDYSDAEEHRTEAMVGNLACELARWAGSRETIDAASIQSLPVCDDLGIEPSELHDIFACAEEILELARVYT